MPPPGCGLRTSTKYWPVQLMVTVMIASWELITVAPTAPTPVTPPVVAEGVNVMVTVATANLVGSLRPNLVTPGSICPESDLVKRARVHVEVQNKHAVVHTCRGICK